MIQLEQALKAMGLAWRDVWVLTVDRRAGTLVVVAADGRKFRAKLGRAGEADSGQYPLVGDPLKE